MSDSPSVLTHGLTKSYGPVQALRGVDLEVRRGEVFGFLGPNGAGKTTTIRCLLDLIRPSGGTVRVLGLDPQAEPVAVRARVGYLPGELHLEDNLSAEAALRFFNRLRGGRADPAFVRQLARRLDLDLGTPIKNLSKGNKQKVGVVQALMHRPELLLLDEPTSGLDPLGQQEVQRLVAEARGAGATIFFSSHILPDVEGVADHVGILRDGRLVVSEDLDTLKQRHAHVRLGYTGLPSDDALAGLRRVPGVVRVERDGRSVRARVDGDVAAVVAAFQSSMPTPATVDTSYLSLDDIFLHYMAEA